MQLDWLLKPPHPAGVPRQRLLYQGLREAIVSGRLAPGTRLPASRTLSGALGIARNCVLFAYEQLAAEGCLVADRQGTRVAALPVVRAPMPSLPDGLLPGLSARAAALPGPEQVRNDGSLLFALGVPDLSAFPIRSWRASLERAWRDATCRQLDYAPHGGAQLLRTALAEHLSTVRGFGVRPEQVLITGGMQAGLDLCARLLADVGDIAWTENPGYPAAQAALTLAGLQLHGLAVDQEGMAPQPVDWRNRPPRLIMVTPSHQYPTGHVMSLARRLELIERARDANAWVVEDDYDSEFNRGGPALPALYGLRQGAPVLYAGTFSKTLYPGLRLGYLVVPLPLAGDFVAVAGRVTRPGNGIEQAALADFIRRGHYTAHLRRMRKRYEVRQRALRAALAHDPGPEVAISGGDAGLHVVLWLPPDLADTEVAARARRLGLGLRALSSYARSPVSCNGLVLGYGNVDETQMPEAVRRLRLAMST